MTNSGKHHKRKSAKTVERSSPGPSRRELWREAYLAKWRAVDWSKSDVALAEEMGISNSTVGYNRRRVGAPKSPRYHQYRSKFREPFLAKWRSWDWAKQDAELARETGLSRERIRQIRRLIGAPRSPHHRRFPTRLRRTTIALQWAADNLDRLRGLSGAEVRRKHGFNRLSPVYEFLKAQGVLRNGRRKYRWDLMNWELPSGVLERIWKVSSNMAGRYRYQNRLVAPRWSLLGGPGAMQRRGELRAYNRAVKAEERKAARYFAEGEAAG